MTLTTYFNSKQRVIRVGARGGKYVLVGNRKVYGVKAQYKKNTGGSMVAASPVVSVLPNPHLRKTRKNAGVKRGPRVKASPARSPVRTMNSKNFYDQYSKITNKSALVITSNKGVFTLQTPAAGVKIKELLNNTGTVHMLNPKSNAIFDYLYPVYSTSIKKLNRQHVRYVPTGRNMNMQAAMAGHHLPSGRRGVHAFA